MDTTYSRDKYEVQGEVTSLKNDDKYGETVSVLKGFFARSRTTPDCAGKESKGHRPVAPKKASRARMGVSLAACFYLQFCTGGTHTSLGVIYVELISYFNSSRSEAALVQSLYAGFCVGGGIFFTNLVVKYEAGLIVMFSSVVTTASFCASAFAPNIQVVIVLIGVVNGLASSIMFLVAYVVVSWTFQEKRKAALSVTVVGGAVGQVVSPYIVTEMIEQVFWKDTVIILGAFLFLNCIPCGLIIYYSRHYFVKGDGDGSKLKTTKLVDRNCITDMAFMVYLIPFVGFNAFVPVEMWFVVDMGILKGFSMESGATLVAVMGILMACSRIVAVVWLGFRQNARIEMHLIYLYLFIAVGHLIVSEATVYWAMMLGIVIGGFTCGLVFTVIPGLQIDMRGLEMFPQTTAICNCLGGVGMMFGGYAGGLTFDITGSYSFVFYLATGTTLFSAISMVIVSIILRNRRTRKIGYQQL